MKLLLQSNIVPFDLQLANTNDLKWSVWNDLIEVGENNFVIFNTFSRNAVLVEKSEIKEPKELKESYLHILLRLGILVDATKDEKKEWDAIYSKGKEDLDAFIVLKEKRVKAQSLLRP